MLKAELLSQLGPQHQLDEEEVIERLKGKFKPIFDKMRELMLKNNDILFEYSSKAKAENDQPSPQDAQNEVLARLQQHQEAQEQVNMVVRDQIEEMQLIV